MKSYQPQAQLVKICMPHHQPAHAAESTAESLELHTPPAKRTRGNVNHKGA